MPVTTNTVDHAFERAKEAVHSDQLQDALGELERASVRRPLDVEAKLYVAWTHVRMRRTSEGRLGIEYEALNELARRAFSERRARGLAMCVLGHDALRHGRRFHALRFFRHALMDEPGLIDARRQIHFLEEPRRRCASSSLPPVRMSLPPQHRRNTNTMRGFTTRSALGVLAIGLATILTVALFLN